MPERIPRIGMLADAVYGQRAGTGYAAAQLIEGLRRDHADAVQVVEVVRRPGQGSDGALALPHPLFGRSIYGWYPYAAHAVRPSHCDLLHNPAQVPTWVRPRVPYIITVHDLIPLLYPETTRRGRYPIYRLLYGRTLASAARIVVSSQGTRRDLQRLYPVDDARIAVVPLGVSERFAPGAAAPQAAAADVRVLARLGVRPPYILYVGTLEGRKGLATLVDAYRVLIARGLPHRLVLAGARGWKTAAFDAALARLADPGRVTVTGYVADDDLPALYRGADLFAFPSEYEGFGLPPLEAMASGTPVVAGDCPAVAEVVADAALLHAPRDAAGLARCMGRVLEDPGLAAHLRAAGLARARGLTWGRCVAAYLAEYRRVLGWG